ncbi:MAG: GIY-YIG nuclease family protein [Chloroflexota bacterium]|nr:GIY-YIG nuclease family protein [Chloroflexota bacterium]
MNGRTIRIYLIDGTPQGILNAEIMNWTGKVLVAPRTQLAELAKRKEAQRTGIYVLSGADPDSPLKERVYIGESDNVFERLMQHNKDDGKEFWERTVVVISKDENLTKAHVRYLESRLIQIAHQAHRSNIHNGTMPDTVYMPEPDIADMEYFLTQVQTLLPVLGFSFAVPVPTHSVIINSATQVAIDSGSSSSLSASPIFEINAVGVHGEAQEVQGEFVVLKGSMVRKAAAPSMGETYKEVREQLRKDAKLIDSSNPDLWILTEDIPFSSPSTAIRILVGASYNGRTYWKIKGTQQTYKHWQESQIANADGLAQNTDTSSSLQ